MSELVHPTRHAGVTVLCLDDGKVNAMSPAMLRALHLELARAEDERAAVVITGNARVFCAGFDLNTLKTGGAATGEMLELGARLVHRLLSHPAPVVAAVNGPALAMGAFIALAADLRLAAADIGAVKIAANEVAIGLTLPRFATALVRHRLNPSHLVRAAVTAHTWDAASALSAGWFDELVPATELAARALQAAAALAALPRDAWRGTKRRVHEPLLAELDAGIAADAQDWRAFGAGG